MTKCIFDLLGITYCPRHHSKARVNVYVYTLNAENGWAYICTKQAEQKCTETLRVYAKIGL
jgi:hypothetical protein